MTLLGASLFSTEGILAKLISIPGMVLFFSFRGYFQAWVAKKLGDTLPERMGRLTLNPAKHIDLIGFVMLLLLGFGFGKPIQFDATAYKHPKRDNAIQILSAPASGIIIAFFELLVSYILTLIGANFTFGSSTVYTILVSIFNSAWSISLYLKVLRRSIPDPERLAFCTKIEPPAR